MAKYYWSKENCGNRAIVITWSDLVRIVEKECVKYVFGSKKYGHKPDSFLKWVEEKNETKADKWDRRQMFMRLGAVEARLSNNN